MSSPEQGNSTGAAAATLGGVFSFDIAANEETSCVEPGACTTLYRAWLGEGAVKGQLLIGM